MNLFEKLLKITSEIGSVNKNLEVGVGKSSYKAVGEADVLKAVKELEARYKVYSYPKARRIVFQDTLQTEKEYQGQITRGNQVILRIETDYEFVNVENPEERITVMTYGDGVDTQDKAPGKAMTYADKYALLKAYKIITGDDPDQFKSPSNDEVVDKNRKLTPEEAKILDDIFARRNINPTASLQQNYGVSSTTELTLAQRNSILKSLGEKL